MLYLETSDPGTAQLTRAGVNIAPKESTGLEVAGKNGVIVSGAFCAICKKRGHAKSYCPEAEDVELTQEQNLSLSQVMPCPDVKAEKDWLDEWLNRVVLIDSGSTISSVRNPALIKDVLACEHTSSRTNGGQMTYDKEGDLKLLPLVVLYNANSLANLVALLHVCDNY